MTFEEQFVELLRQLVPSPEWLELLKQTILSIWKDELGQVSDVRESVQKRITQIRARLRRLDEAFLYEIERRPDYVRRTPRQAFEGIAA